MTVRFAFDHYGNDLVMGEGRTGAPFKGWQWPEIVLTAVLVWTQIIVQVVLDQLLLAALLGLILLGLFVHIATWIVPLARERRTKTGSSLLGHGERQWVIVVGLCVLLVGIAISCAAALDLIAHGYHQTAQASVWWAVAILVLGLVIAVIGNLVVQLERIRVRRDAA
jgi:hypothetical protein